MGSCIKLKRKYNKVLLIPEIGIVHRLVNSSFKLKLSYAILLRCQIRDLQPFGKACEIRGLIFAIFSA